jgi:thioredoxin 1
MLANEPDLSRPSCARVGRNVSAQIGPNPKDEDLMPGHKSIDRIQTVTASTFDRLVLKGEGPIVVEFMSYGCAHCGVIEPDLQQVAEIVKSNEKIFRINVGVDQDLAEQYQIQGTPTLVMFLNGEVVGRDEGPSPIVSNILASIKQPYGL